MAEFTVIETQEQLEKVIADRVERAERLAKEKAKEKYADYEEVKKKNSEYETRLKELQTKLDEADGKLKTHDATVEELEKKVQKYETDSAKTRIALDMGLPYALAERLSGESEDEIKEDARKLVDLMGGNKQAPLGSNEPTATGNAEDAAWRQLAKTLESE